MGALYQEKGSRRGVAGVGTRGAGTRVRGHGSEDAGLSELPSPPAVPTARPLVSMRLAAAGHLSC